MLSLRHKNQYLIFEINQRLKRLRISWVISVKNWTVIRYIYFFDRHLLMKVSLKIESFVRSKSVSLIWIIYCMIAFTWGIYFLYDSVMLCPIPVTQNEVVWWQWANPLQLAVGFLFMDTDKSSKLLNDALAVVTTPLALLKRVFRAFVNRV